MPRQMYSDKSIKNVRSGKMAEDEMMRSKALADEARSEQKEAQRRMRKQQEDQYWPEDKEKKEL